MLILFLLIGLLQSKPYTAEVTSISDGDTFKVLHEGREVRIRLVNIDCPEKRQPFGTRARQELSKLIFSKRVTIHAKGKDRYGRTLAEVYVGKTCINKLMVERGFAWHFKKYSSDKEYALLELKARKNKSGLWADPKPIAPWDWRKMQSQKKPQVK